MSKLTYNDAVDVIVDIIKVPTKAHKEFLGDANIIAGKITATMNRFNVLYNCTITNLKQTATSIKDNQFDLPVDNAFILLLKVPFKITPMFNQRCGDPLLVRLMCGEDHPLVKSSVLSFGVVHMMISSGMHFAISQLKTVTAGGGRLYGLRYENFEHFHFVTATELNAKNQPCIIRFDFITGIKMSMNKYPIPKGMPDFTEGCDYWVATCGNMRSYDDMWLKIVPSWQHYDLQDKSKLKNVLRLVNHIIHKDVRLVEFSNMFAAKNDLLLLACEKYYNGLDMRVGSLLLEFLKNESERAVHTTSNTIRNIVLDEYWRCCECLKTIYSIFQSYSMAEYVDMHEFLKHFQMNKELNT